MLVANFGVIKDFKSTDKYAALKSAIAKSKLSFSRDIRKLKSYSIYSSDITHVIGCKLKAIWTIFRLNGEESLVLLDVVNGKYENSKYLSQKLILEHFFHGGKRITHKITSAQFEDSVYKLGYEIEAPLYFFHRKVVELSCHQEDILRKELLPGFYILSGIAGSGKTSLAYLKLKELYKSGGNYLFTTSNRNLAEYLERLFREEEGDRNVEFLGYKDLVDIYFQRTRSLEKVGFAEFSNYAQGKSEKAGVDHRMLYSLMQYITSKPDIVPGKRDFFQQFSEQQFKYCVNLYGRYIQYLEKELKIDLSLAALEPNGGKYFDCIIVDETQDLSPREIENINLLKNGDTGVILFNVDSNQHSNISLPVKYLKSHKCTKEVIVVLDASFRLPIDISHYAQAIVDVRSFVMEGVPDKDMIREFSSSNCNQGNIVHISLDDARQQIIDTVSIAVIAFDDRGKEELEQLLPHITQVFTADEIKGLEFETIIVVDPYDKFSDIFACHHEIVWDKSQVKTNLPKDIITVDHAIKILFNRFFTSVTRSKNSLYILERNPESKSNYCFKFKEYLTRNIQEGEICQDDRITDDEWIQQINILASNGNISQAIKAYRKREFSIDKIKREYLAILTYEVSLVSVLSDIYDLEKIPEMHVGVKLYRDILSHKSFKEIPEHLINTDFCRIAINTDINNISHVPAKYPEIYRYFLEKFGYSLSKISNQLLTLEICLIAVEEEFRKTFNDIPHKYKHVVYDNVLQKLYHGSLEKFPAEFVNPLVAEMAIKLNPRNLEYLPVKFRNGVYKLVLNSYDNSLKNFPMMKLMDECLAKLAAGLNVYNLKYLSDEFLIEAVYKEALYSYGNSLQDFPKEFVNDSLAVIAVQVMPSNLKFPPYNNSLEGFPGDLITQEIAEVAAEINGFNLFGIYASNKKFDMGRIYQSALKSYGNSLEHFPKKLINPHLSKIAVTLDVKNLKYLSSIQKTSKVYRSAINNFNNSFEHFPKELIDRELAKVAIGLDASNLHYLPKVLLTEDFYRSILVTLFSSSLEQFPKELVDDRLAKIAVRLNIENLKHLSDELANDNYSLALEIYNNSLAQFPEHLINMQLAKLAVGADIHNLRYLSSHFLAQEDLRNILLGSALVKVIEFM